MRDRPNWVGPIFFEAGEVITNMRLTPHQCGTRPSRSSRPSHRGTPSSGSAPSADELTRRPGPLGHEPRGRRSVGHAPRSRPIPAVRSRVGAMLARVAEVAHVTQVAAAGRYAKGAEEVGG